MGRERKQVLASSNRVRARAGSIARLGRHTECLVSEWSVHRNAWNPGHFCRSPRKGREQDSDVLGLSEESHAPR